MARRARSNVFQRGVSLTLKWFLVVLLAPAVSTSAHSFMQAMMELDALIPGRLIAFLRGVSVYGLVHLVIWKPRPLYLMGHRVLQRFLEAVLGGQVQAMPEEEEIADDKKRRQPAVSEEYVIAAVSPALVPVYTILFTITVGVLHATRAADIGDHWLLFGMGITFALHSLMALDTIQETRRQQSIAGYFLTVELLWLSTCVVTVGCLAFLLPQYSVGRFLQQAFDHAMALYGTWWQYLQRLPQAF